MAVTLESIDRHNWRRCIALQVREDQVNLIAPNVYSLVQAKACPECVPLAVYDDDTMIGFVMYEPRGNTIFSIHRCMIDAQHQQRGFGRRAMELTISRIRQRGGLAIYRSCRPENEVAKRLYESLGFVYEETEPDGEIVYRLGSPRQMA